MIPMFLSKIEASTTTFPFPVPSTGAMKAYVADVKASKFPEPQHTYSMLKEERPKFDEWAKAQKK
jgi:hypothetical protein